MEYLLKALPIAIPVILVILIFLISLSVRSVLSLSFKYVRTSLADISVSAGIFLKRPLIV